MAKCELHLLDLSCLQGYDHGLTLIVSTQVSRPQTSGEAINDKTNLDKTIRNKKRHYQQGSYPAAGRQQKNHARQGRRYIAVFISQHRPDDRLNQGRTQ